MSSSANPTYNSERLCSTWHGNTARNDLVACVPFTLLLDVCLDFTALFFVFVQQLPVSLQDMRQPCAITAASHLTQASSHALVCLGQLFASNTRCQCGKDRTRVNESALKPTTCERYASSSAAIEVDIVSPFCKSASLSLSDGRLVCCPFSICKPGLRGAVAMHTHGHQCNCTQNPGMKSKPATRTRTRPARC